MKTTNQRKGFTIIEVVLVLAIAGLIFLMVFIALPAMQRNQRDTQRRNDYSMLSTAITNYSTNNGGKLSRLSDGDNCKGNLSASAYINKDGTTPDGDSYKLYACTWDQFESANLNAADKLNKTDVYVVIGADCDGANSSTGDAFPKENPSKRAFAVYGYVESGNHAYCTASQ
ncbi:type II secretion system protein [Candidatus Saccharibacteria bacterium]|nr:type II secretion system protein [Candidatus Saccharibacteria bacterium]